MKSRQTDMLKGVIWKEILFFFFPIMFGSLFQQLYNTVDAMVVGNFVGKAALGAVGGSTGTVINLIVGFVVGISSGATVVIAQAYGSHDEKGVSNGVYSGMFLAIVLGAILTVLGIYYAPSIMLMLNVPSDIFDYSVIYMRIYMVGLIPALIYNTGAGILRAIGDSKRPLYFLIAACLTNIVLDILFVVVFHLDVAGVAYATTISQVVSCVLTLYVLFHTQQAYQFQLRKLHYDFTTLKTIVAIGLPMGIQGSLYSVANLFIQARVNSYGTDTVAAYTAFGKIDAIFWNTSGALGTSTLTFVGQNFGAKQFDRLKKGIHHSMMIYLIGSLLISTCVFFFGEYFYRLFTPETQVIAIGMQMLRMLCPFWSTFVFVEVLSQSMRACGDSFIPMLMTALGIGALRIVWIIFYPAQSVFDSLLVYPASWILTSSIFLLYYFYGGWLKRAIVRRFNV